MSAEDGCRVIWARRVLRRMRQVVGLIAFGGYDDTPFDCAYLIARCSAEKMARCSASFLQLNSHGSAK